MTQSGQQPVEVSHAYRFVKSPAFTCFFKSGMKLVEVTATYLDELGRIESKRLEGDVALAYAKHSVRLTTRLMQIVSWLLLMRAVNEGEIDFETSQEQKTKMHFQDDVLYVPNAATDALPATLLRLMQQTDFIVERIAKLERSTEGENLFAEHEDPDRENDAHGLQERLKKFYANR